MASLKSIGESLRQKLETSLWVFPAGAVVAAVGLARGLIAIDRRIAQSEEHWTFVGGDPQSARELLSTIASSILSFTGLVFSITVLVMQLASTQYSSRVLRTFLEDKVTKVAMSTFVGSFVFAMVLLPDVRDERASQAAFVPAIATLVAFLLVLVSVGVFIQYIDHMAHSIRAVHVVRRVGAETRASIERCCPHPVAPSPPLPSEPWPAPDRVITNEGRGGVVTGVDDEGLVELASRCGVVLGLVPEVGSFVPSGAPLFKVWGQADLPLDELRGAVILGEERTLHQDPAFGFRQLVDVAERALSPGLNDPTTAVQALDQLHELLRLLATRELPPVRRLDARGELRLIFPRAEWEAYVHLALDEVRHYGRGSIQVARRLEALLIDLESVAPAHRRGVLVEQRRLLERSIERSFEAPVDRQLATEPSTEGQGSRGR